MRIDEYEDKNAYLYKMSLLSSLYNSQCNYESAKTTLLSTIEIANDNLLAYDKNLIKILYNNLSVAYNNTADIDGALAAILKAIEISNSIILDYGENPEDHTRLLWPAMEYGNLADIYITKGQNTEAEQILTKCVSFYNHNYPQSDEIRHLYDGLMYIAERQGDFLKMRRLAEESYKQSLQSYVNQSFGLTKIQRTDYWYRCNLNSSEIFSQLALKDDSFVDIAYDAALIEKGFLLNYDKQIRNNILNSNDSELSSIYALFTQADMDGSPEKNDIEESLMYQYSMHPEFINNLSFATWRDVKSQLAKDDLAIEFVTSCSDGKNISYSALLLKSDWETPKIVKISSARELESLFAKGPKAYLDNDRFYTMIWGEIEPYFNGIKKIYFSPAGVLSQMNIEILRNAKGNPINKVYDICRVSSTAKLFSETSNELSSATLFGGLNYNLDTTSMQTISRGYTRGGHYSIKPNIKDTLTRKGWSYLPGTKKEVENISEILDKRKIQYVTIMSDFGTEESFKDLSGKHIPILHIATHGFYLSEKQAARLDVNLLHTDTDDSHSYPLRRCGLMMSGGQHAWLGEVIPNDIDDGILTAEEIAGLNLSGTDLLVLSACQTGLGEIGGDGVYGLQRGFKIAGVNTIIMSLWEVSDEATEVLMTEFYSLLTKGKSKCEAFDAAVNTVREKYDSPEYWAAFIMLD